MNGVFCGSFCPITLGHLDIIVRSSKLCDKLFVAVLNNCNKEYSIALEDRFNLVCKATANLPNVVVAKFDGALIDFCIKNNANLIIKSGRNAQDIQYEMDMADINKQFSNVETVFLACDKQFQAVSSSLVRELVILGKDISKFVPNGLEQNIVKLLTK
ncbi:MAG: pantetheine-phosphate adenylyltransferase [Clostridia bacterium]